MYPKLGIHFSFFIWVYPFHLGVLGIPFHLSIRFSLERTFFICVYSFHLSVHLFHLGVYPLYLGVPFSFGCMPCVFG